MKTRLLIAIAALAMFVAAPAMAQNSPTYVELTTGKGKIVLELNAQAAPKTVANFVGYVQKGHYNGTIFHRVIENFMIQGGGMDSKMQERQTGAPIANEAKNGLKNDRYTVAMARTNDPHSATAQFFINTNNNEFLNFKSESVQGWGYTVFGKVVAGQGVVDEIAKAKTGRMGMHENVPVMPIVIEKAVVLTDYKK